MKLVNVVFGVSLVMLTCFTAHSQNVFLADRYGTIYTGPNPGGPVSIFATLPNLTAMAFDPSGNLFVTQYALNQGVGNVVEITSGGIQSTFATGLIGPNSLAFDRAGNLFVACGQTGNIYEYTPGGTRSTFASGLPTATALAFDSAGNLFASTGGTIMEFTPTGASSTFATGFTAVTALAFDSSGNLFASVIRPRANGIQIVKITPSGVITTFASGSSYVDLAFDNAGNLFAVYDNLDEFTPAGVKTSLDGSFLNCIAFQGVTLPVPEPSSFALSFFGASFLFVVWRAKRR